MTDSVLGGMFGRDEILVGLPARRASALLYAIERRTAVFVRQSRNALATYLTPRTTEEQERSFMAALASGRTEQTRPSAQDLERYAPQWADLVPQDPGVRAALARLIASAYRLTPDVAPRIRAALALDDAIVAAAYQRLHGVGLTTIWVPRLTVRERLLWRRARITERLESLPPFWMAYALMLTETIGEGILAVPIAVAAIGPIAGVVVLVVLGLVNMITLGALVESITRNGSMRYGTAYFGRLLTDLLGRSSSLALGIALVALNLVTLMAYYIAFGSVLEGATSVAAVVWVALLFGVDVVYLRRGSIGATVATAIVVGAVNTVLILLISLLALGHATTVGLTRVDVPLLDGQPLDVSALQLIFGVVLLAYFGHTSAAAAAKVVLQTDPTGRALLWGNLWAMATVIALYSLATVSFNGALGTALIGYAGTALTPLAAVVGPAVSVLGALYVTLAIGLGSIYISLSLFNQVVEILPSGVGGGETTGRRRWFHDHAASRPGRTALGVAPALAVFLLVEALLVLDAASFSAPLGIVGTLTVPLLGGIFPLLMVMAARRTGELVPGRVVRVFGARLTVGVLSGLFLAAVFLHGLVIWQSPFERAAAIGVGVGVLILLAWLARSRVFHARTVIELRRPGRDGTRAVVAVVSAGTPVPVEPEEVGGSTVIRLPATVARDIMVWAHVVTPEGVSEGSSGTFAVDGAGSPGPTPLVGGRATVGAPSGPLTVQIDLATTSR